MYVDPSQQQMIVTQPRQILVPQPAPNQMMIPTSLKPGQTVIVQNPAGSTSAQLQQRQVVLQQGNSGQILLSQGQMLVASGAQGGQYVLQNAQQSTATAAAYVVAQSQTAVMHGQPQTVLVTQTSQQQGTGTKTIIILQQQPAGNAATHHQKVSVAYSFYSY